MNNIKYLLGISILTSLASAHTGEDHSYSSAEHDHSEEVHELTDFDVVTTGTRTERLIHEAPVKTELLIAEDFDDYNVSSLKDALKLIPSARFENDCQNCGLNQIQLLGLSTDYTAILFDGAPLYSGLAKVYGADLFPAIFIDRIEVVKGGSSVLYGPEAIAGVVNLITAEPAESGFEIDAGFSSVRGDTSDWESSFRGDFVADDGTFALSAYGFYTDREGLDLSTDGFTEIPEFENTVVGLQTWWNPNNQMQLKANYQYMDQSHRGGSDLSVREEDAIVAESLAHEIHTAQVRWDHQINSDFDYSLGASYMNIERESFYGGRSGSEQLAYDNRPFPLIPIPIELWVPLNQGQVDDAARSIFGLTEDEVIYLESQFNHYLDAHTISYGVQYRYEEVKDGPLFSGTGTPTTKDDFANIGVFVQDQWKITEGLELVPGVRFDKHDNVDDAIFSPRLAAIWTPNEEVTLRASWSTGFNAPGAFNEDQHIGVRNGEGVVIRNAPGLEEESSQTFSFGGEFRPGGLDGKVVLHSQIHLTLLEDTFDIVDTGAPGVQLRENGPDSEIFVWESNLNWQITDHFSVDAGLSYIKARFDDPVERVTGLITNEYTENPEWTGHFGLVYENHDLFDAFVLLNYTGSMIAVGEDADIWRNTPDFYVVDLGISKEFHIPVFDSITLAAGIENIFDDRQDDLQDNGEDRDVTYFYGPSKPRTYYVKATLEW